MAGEATALQVLAVAPEHDPTMLLRACVDCGLNTGRFCDHCLAEVRYPKGDSTGRGWAMNQPTPLCSFCDNARNACHFCLGILVTRPVEIYRGKSREEVLVGVSDSVGDSIWESDKDAEKVMICDEVSLVQSGMDQKSKTVKTLYSTGYGDGIGDRMENGWQSEAQLWHEGEDRGGWKVAGGACEAQERHCSKE